MICLIQWDERDIYYITTWHAKYSSKFQKINTSSTFDAYVPIAFSIRYKQQMS